jgi:hypothetical protein
MEFSQLSNDVLSANLAAIKDMPGMEDMASALRTELDEREAREIRLAATAKIRGLAQGQSEMLARILASEVSEISDTDGGIVKNARLTLVKLITVAYEISTGKAEKALLVLADKSGQTDVAGNVDRAVEYVNAHKSSTVYRQTESHPADIAQSATPKTGDSKADGAGDSKADGADHAPADAIEAAMNAGEKSGSKASK